MKRWKCEPCNKTWIYPVKKCFYCKGKISSFDINPQKVVAITRINVPSPLHPIVPYNVVLLEDENGNKVPRKTMRDYNLGDMFIEEKASTDNAVSIVRTKYDVKDALNHALNLINYEFKPESKILIKPNIETAAYAYQAVCTNPRVVNGIISVLLDNNVKKENIILAEKSTFGNDTTKSAGKAGILSVCKKHDVKFVDISMYEFIEKQSEDYTFKVSKLIEENDLIINAPILKTHGQYGIVGAIENMSRILHDDTLQNMAKKDYEKQLAYLNALCKGLVIADGTIGMQANGPYATGEPAYLNIVMASRDPLAIDSVFSYIGMFDKPSYIQTAEDVGVGNSNIEKIETVGNELDTVVFELKKAQTMSPNPNIKVINGNPWPGEYQSLFGLLSKFNNVRTYRTNVAIGSKLNVENLPKERLIAFGDSAILRLQELGIKPMAEIKGNPPESVESYVLLKKLLTSKEEVELSMIDHAKSKIMSKMKNMGG